jgi:hypothetical protein
MIAIAREAVVLAEATDFINHRVNALMDLSQGFRTRERGGHFRLRGALRLHRFKGNLVSESATRLWLVA